MKILSFLNYLLLIAVITIVMGVIYATVQQSYRTGANDPQIQMSEDIGAKIQQGKSVENIFQADAIDISNSLSPFIVLYDASGKPLHSTGYLNGKMAQLPVGVFDIAKSNGQDRVTWQPQGGVRMAMVLIHINSSPVEFVAVGRSLREVEIRESNLIKMIFVGWILCLVIVLLWMGSGYYKKSKL